MGTWCHRVAKTRRRVQIHRRQAVHPVDVGEEGIRALEPTSRLLRAGFFGLAVWLHLSSTAHAEGVTDYSQRTCTIGAVDRIREWLSAIVSAEELEAFLGNTRPLPSASSGGDCGVTSVTESCDLIFVIDSAEPPLAIIGEGAPDGPMPQTRAAISFLADAKIPLRGIVVHHVDLVDDKGYLSFIVAETRDIVAQNGFDGAVIPVCQCGPDCGPAMKK